jgi:hypothetical protein
MPKRDEDDCVWIELIYELDNISMKTIVTIALSGAVLITSNAFATDAPKANPFNQTLSAAPAVELPAKTADLVLHAKAADRSTTTVTAVKSAVGIHPTAAPAIVGAVARSVPDMASVAAGAAAAEQPKQASAIAKAAATGAPAQAGKIVAAVCRAVPSQYREVALAVSQVVPSANEEILRAVAVALPELKLSIDRALVSAKSVSVSEALAQVTAPVAPALASGAPAARGPAVGPPYVPLTTTPANVTPASSGPVPPGGRNYATP